ncbi:ATP-binding protein [Streptomyces sp. NPDC001840]
MKAHPKKPSIRVSPVEQDHLGRDEAERGTTAPVTRRFLPVGTQEEVFPAASCPTSLPDVHRYVTEMARHPQNVSGQRRIVAAFLRHWGIGTPDVAHSVVVVVSELLSNAVRYGEAEAVGLSLTYDSLLGKMRIEVNDHTPSARAEPCRPDDDQEGGRGLFLVDALTTAWGVSEDGTTTWCTINLMARCR